MTIARRLKLTPRRRHVLDKICCDIRRGLPASTMVPRADHQIGHQLEEDGLVQSFQSDVALLWVPTAYGLQTWESM